MGKTRKQFSKEFKAKVAFDALKGDKTTAEISSEYGVHSSQVASWKKELKAALPDVFARNGAADKDKDNLLDSLYRQVGQLQMENTWLKKKLPF